MVLGNSLLVFFSLLATGVSQTVHKMAVRSDIRFRFATTEVMSVMSNDNHTAQELLFDFTLPKDAFIANFSMEIEGKMYPGNVKEKQKAREQYLQALHSGSSGGLVEQNARHSNKFDVSVNIAAGSSVTFRLIYQELLRRRSGVYEHAIYVNPTDNIRNYSVEVYIQERTEIRNVRTPAIRQDITNNVVEEDQNSLSVITSPSSTSAYVVYSLTSESLQQQKAGWFVVQYDVDTVDDAGELLVVDGYFVHFFIPPDDLPSLPLDIVFVLDVSGSMQGRKIEQLKDAMKIILDDLQETDRFNILLFSGDVKKWQQSLQDASSSNIDGAQGYVENIKATGGTNIHLALSRGLEMLHGSRELSRMPLLFFLTDGEATAGVTDPRRIVQEASNKNEGVVNIYSLAFGSGADYNLLRQISARNKGFARKIYEAADASQQVSNLYRQISAIALRNLTVSYHSSSQNDSGQEIVRVDNTTLTICELPTLFSKSDFVVAGKLDNPDVLLASSKAAGGLKLTVSGLGAAGKVNFVLEENDLKNLILDGEDPPFWSIPRDLSKITERAWAFLSIKQLLEEKVTAQENKEMVEDLDKRILELSLKYHFVTPLTSMVVTRPEDQTGKPSAKEASIVNDEDIRAGKGIGIRPMKMSKTFLSGRQISYDMPEFGGFGRPNAERGPGDGFDRWSGGKPSMTQNFPRLKLPTSPNTKPPNTKSRSTMSPKYIGEKKRKCMKKKMILLQFFTSKRQLTHRTCFKLENAGKPQTYIMFADPKANYSITLGLKNSTVYFIEINENNSNVTVNVGSEGELTLKSMSTSSNVQVSPDRHVLQVRIGQDVVTVNVTQDKCMKTVISIDLTAWTDYDAKAIATLQKAAAKRRRTRNEAARFRKMRSRKTKNRKRSKKGRTCQKLDVQDKLISLILNGEKHLRYQLQT